MRHGICGHAVWPLRPPDRVRLPHVGVLRSGRPLLASQARRPAGPSLAERTNRARAKPGRSWPTHGRAPSLTWATAIRRSLGRRVCHDARSGGGEPDASRDAHGISRARALWHADPVRHGTPMRAEALLPAPPAVMGRSLRLLDLRRSSRPVHVGCPSPEPGTHGRPITVQPPPCIGRYEGTARFLGRRGELHSLCHRHEHGDSAAIRVWCRHVRSTPGHGNHVRPRHRTPTSPGPNKAEQTEKLRSQELFAS